MTAQDREFDPLVDEQPSRYVVGIDLGTTNCAVAYVDTRQKSGKVRVFRIPQLVAPAEIETRETLPAFHYQPVLGPTSRDALHLPWSDPPTGECARKTGKKKKTSGAGRIGQHQSPSYVVGFWARDEGTLAPGRLITSAKSWLCHTGVDRTAELLPWHGAADVDRLSPVEVSARYLRHVRDAWNAEHPSELLSDQEVVVTLPASFDEVARELTIEAARRADLTRVVLIEEPQAAFYAWIDKHADDWEKQVQPGQNILVCDIGGGTTDLTLIRVRKSTASKNKKAPKVQFHRVAVGNHLILGGDNLDLALAQHVERKLTSAGRLEPRQWSVLVRSCRHVKESLLGKRAPQQVTINLPGSGSKVIGGALQIIVTREEIIDLLVEGFLPKAKLQDIPRARQSGFQEFGLPYAPDAAITRYLAAFLTAHRNVDVERKSADRTAVRPDIVLLNGGFFASSVLRARWLEVLTSWFRQRKDHPWPPLVLENDRLDLAVARGAAYYGVVRRGVGVRIAANLARSYYISVESDEPAAVCLVPGDAEPGVDIELADTTFDLLVSQPVEFPLYVSSTRLGDRPGAVVTMDREQMTPLPPIRTVLQSERRNRSATISVKLHARLTEIGTIDLWCEEVDSQRSWRLQFDIRSTTQTDCAAHDGIEERTGLVDETVWNQCYARIADVFGEHGSEKPEKLMKQLGTVLDADRSQWPPSLLRRMWEALTELSTGRRRSPLHEARWLNLLGYALRPGYGMAVDDWRVAETWRQVRGRLAFQAVSSRTESLILWRRLAGGLSTGQQAAIAEPYLRAIRGLYGRFTGSRKKSVASLQSSESIEIWRLLGSLELLNVKRKIELGDMIAELLPRAKLANSHQAMVWAWGRLGQRSPVYGPLNTILPAEKATVWLESLYQLDRNEPIFHLAVMQLTRRTNDRYRDLPEDQRERAVTWLRDHRARPHLIKLVREGDQLDAEEQREVFGESLPKGLRLQSA